MHIIGQAFHLTLSALNLMAAAAATTFKSGATLQIENLALRRQLAVLRRSVKRPN